MNALSSSVRPLATFAAGAGVLTLSLAAGAAISTVPTMEPVALSSALNGPGLTITSVVVRNGMPGQIGTYSGFRDLPVTIRDGVVLSSGSVASVGPLAEVLDPLYDPASPPAAVNSQMYPPEDDGGTAEFNAYGATGAIANFTAAFDVASLEVHFTLDQSSQVKFDFIFASVEFPFYTSSFTDAFLVFLDGTESQKQITYDNNGDPVQVAVSFAGLTVTNDVNTAFAAPHGLIHHLTTTTAMLNAGDHTIRFEVGDVNDHILDSAVFISNLRTGTGTEGTGPTEDCNDADVAGPNQSRGHDGQLTADDIIVFLGWYFDGNDNADFAGPNQVTTPDGELTADDIIVFLSLYFAGC